jgi:hypothetical protein
VEPEALVRDEQQWKMPGCILQFPFQTSVLELRRSHGSSSYSVNLSTVQYTSKATASGAKLKVYILTALKSETF